MNAASYFNIIFTCKHIKQILINDHNKLILTNISPQSTEVFYLDDGEPKIGPIEKVYVTTLVTPMVLASSFNRGILKIIAKK